MSYTTTLHSNTTIGEIIDLKLKINELSIQNLDAQKEFTECERHVLDFTLSRISLKRHLVNQLSELFTAQKTSYDTTRQAEINSIYHKLNKLDDPNEEMQRTYQRMTELQEKMKTICGQIQFVTSQIPDVQYVRVL